jgi:hypothetical protein
VNKTIPHAPAMKIGKKKGTRQQKEDKKKEKDIYILSALL